MSAATPLVGVSQLADRYDAFLVDQWGVLHDGHSAFGEAIDVMRRLHDAGKQLIILSNSSRRAVTTRENLLRMDIDPALFDGYATSGEEVWRALHERTDAFYRSLGTRCLVLQWRRDDHFFDGLDLEPVDDIDSAEFILLLGTERDRFPEYETILRRAVERGIPLVCANGDFVSITPEGELVQCPGVLARRFEALGGQVRWHGKPTPAVYRMALDGVAPAARVLAIGDSLHHDVGGAIAAELDSLFISDGIHRPELIAADETAHTDDSLQKLYEQYGATPSFVARRLRW